MRRRRGSVWNECAHERFVQFDIEVWRDCPGACSSACRALSSGVHRDTQRHSQVDREGWCLLVGRWEGYLWGRW